MLCFVGISKGKWVVRRDTDKGKERRTFPLDGKKMSAYFKKHRIRSVSCSSSVDFPKDYGAPKGWNIGRVTKALDRALGWEFTSAELRKADPKYRYWVNLLRGDPAETPEDRVAQLKAAEAIATLIE